MLPYSPLHHLLRPTSGDARDDERERLRRADRLRRRRRAPAAGRDRRPSASTTGRSRSDRRPAPGATRRCDVTRLRAAQRRPAARLAAAARMRRQEHVLRRQGPPRVGRPPHRGPQELRDPDVVSRWIAHFERLFDVAPEVVCADLHPDYLSTRSSARASSILASSTTTPSRRLARGGPAETPSPRSTTAAAMASTPVWGGELLVGGLERFERAGALFAVRLPGGDRAVAEPWRMACAWLAAASGDDVPPIPATLREVEPRRWEAIAELARSGVASPPTTSAGRLFDAVAAICGLRASVNYEGQAASSSPPRPPASAAPTRCRWSAETRSGSPPPWCSTMRRRIAAVAADVEAGVDAAAVARAFTTRSRPPRPARSRRSVAGSTSRARGACSRTGCCSSAPPRCCAKPA